MQKAISRRSLLVAGGATLAFGRGSGAARAEAGVTETEIKLGTTSPYSGPASAYGVYGLAQTAYFKMLNEQGGINGRKVNLISLDNAFNPPKPLSKRAGSSNPTRCLR
jgi:branched-chain amino acid transport system substrate-binding protein